MIAFEAACAQKDINKPEGFLCVIDYPHQNAQCSDIKDPRGKKEVLALSQMDNFVAFSPNTWAEIQTFIHDLKRKRGLK